MNRRLWWMVFPIVAILCLVAHLAFAATPVIVSWNNPTTYTDGTSIDAAKIATITTKVYYTKDQQTWTYWGQVTSGATQFNSTWPLAKGVPGWVSVTSTIPAENIESDKCPPVGYTDQYAPPSSPVNLRIQRAAP